MNLIRIFNSKNINYLYYPIGDFFAKIIILLSIRFFTNYFDKISFGKLTLFWISIPIFSVLIDFSQRSYVKYIYINFKSKSDEVIQSIRIFSFIILLFFYLIFWILNHLDIILIDKELDYLILFCSFFFVIIEISLSYLQIKGDAIKYNIILTIYIWQK